MVIVAVVVIVMRDDRVLAMRRSPWRDASPGLWETVSGRRASGEEPFDTATRELREETGFVDGDHVDVDSAPVEAYAATRGHEDMIVIVYRAHYRHGDVARSDEHSDDAWLTPDELLARGCPTKLVDAARKALSLPPPSRA